MIPAPPGTFARYKRKDGARPGRWYDHKVIIAWDDDGHPLVVDEETGILTPASNWDNYDGMGRWGGTLGAYAPIAAIAPAEGWRIAYTSPDTGERRDDPLVGWGINAAGDISPLFAADGGIVLPAFDWAGPGPAGHAAGDGYRIYHPSAESAVDKDRKLVSNVYDAVEMLTRHRHRLPSDILRSLESIWTCASAARFGEPYEKFWLHDNFQSRFQGHDVEKCEHQDVCARCDDVGNPDCTGDLP